MIMTTSSVGYNPYRKANGEFATKEEAGAQTEKDYAAALASGDAAQIAEIEEFVVNNMDSTPLGQKILETKYGESTKTKKKTLSDYQNDMIEVSKIQTLTSNGTIRTVHKIIAANPILEKYNSIALNSNSMNSREDFYSRNKLIFDAAKNIAVGEDDLEAYAAYSKLSEIYDNADAIEYHMNNLERLPKEDSSDWMERKKKLFKVLLDGEVRNLTLTVANPFKDEIDSDDIFAYENRREFFGNAKTITLQDGREVRVQEAVIGYSDTGEKIKLTAQQKKHIQQEAVSNAANLVSCFMDVKGSFVMPSVASEYEPNDDFRKKDFTYIGSGAECIAYLHKPTMMVYKVPHQENPHICHYADRSKSSCAINTVAQNVIKNLDKKKLRETQTKYLPTMFLNTPTGDQDFKKIGITVQPYLNKERFLEYTMSKSTSLQLETMGLNDLHSGNVYLDTKTGIVFMNDCVTWGHRRELDSILLEKN